MSKRALSIERAIEALHGEIRQLIETAKVNVVTQVNTALVLTYWHIGKRIKTEVFGSDRREYGAGLLKQLAHRLSKEYGNGYSYSSLTRMAKFYDCLPDRENVATLSQHLSWSHFVEIIKITDATRREFYINMCADGHWSVRPARTN